jgi:hypothetical protein
MAQTYSLDRVIQTVDAGEPLPKEPSRLLVAVDVRTRRAVDRKPWFTLSEFRHYLVSNDADPQHAARVEMEKIPVSDLQHQVEVSVSAQVSCPRGSEKTVAEALFDPAEPPVEMLRRHVTRWLLDESRAGVAELVRRCVHGRAAQEQALAAGIHQRTGLQVRVALTIEAERSLASERVERAHFPVVVRDFDEDQDLGLRIDLEVDEPRRAEAVLGQPRVLELHDRVPDEVKRFIRQEVTLQQYAGELAGGGPAREALVRRLNEFLAPLGRRVGAMVLQTKAAGAVLSFPREVDVPCKVREFPEPVVIGNKVLLLLKDMARYRAAGSPDLDDWLRATLEAVIPRVLFDARYIDLLIGFAPWEERIKTAVDEAAARIGYEIKQFVTAPDLEPIRLREKFLLEPEGTFETRLREVEVNLQLVITTRIPRLERIEPLLNRREDVKTRMAEASLAAVRERLHAVDPERFYMRFHFTDELRFPEERASVETELIELIRQRLEGDPFHAEVIGIVIKIGGTDLIARLKELQKHIRPFTVQVASLHGGVDVTFRGNFRVLGVDSDGWHLFQQLGLGIDEIAEHLQTHLLSLMQTKRKEVLTFKEDKERNDVALAVAAAAREFAATQFGLTIAVLNLRRERTTIEEVLASDETATEVATVQIGSDRRGLAIEAARLDHEGLLAQLATLIKQRDADAAVEGSDTQVAEWNRKIRELRASLGEHDLPTREQVRAAHLGTPVPLPALGNGTSGALHAGADHGAGGAGEAENECKAEPESAHTVVRP